MKNETTIVPKSLTRAQLKTFLHQVAPGALVDLDGIFISIWAHDESFLDPDKFGHTDWNSLLPCEQCSPKEKPPRYKRQQESSLMKVRFLDKQNERARFKCSLENSALWKRRTKRFVSHKLSFQSLTVSQLHARIGKLKVLPQAA
jgi:hypothetical protein